MGTLDQVTQMKSEGRSDAEISGALQQQGVSPKEITDALGQAQIKNAVAGENPMPGEMPPAEQTMPSQTPGSYNPQSQEIPEGMPAQGMDQYAQPPQEMTAQQPYPQQDAYAPDQYAAGGGYETGYYETAPAATDTDTMMEVAEQVFSEKTKKMKKQIDEINELKTLTQTKLDSIAERLKRLETMFDKLQINILEQVSSYGKGFEQTKKEVSMMQDSFGKVVNKIADHAERKHVPVTHTAPAHVPAHPTAHTVAHKKTVAKKKVHKK